MARSIQKKPKVGRERSLLEYAILGLIYRAPHSGYDVRKVFASTLLRLFSDSPGSVYPRLRRLERDGLIRAKGDGAGGRGRRTFRLSKKGMEELRLWVSTPIAVEKLRKNPDAFSLQFSHMSGLVEPKIMIEMLRHFARAFSVLEDEVKGFQDAKQDVLPATGWLVLNLGASLCRARIRWARQTIDALQNDTAK